MNRLIKQTGLIAFMICLLVSCREQAVYDVVIVARSRCVDAEYRKMEEAYLKAVKKLGLLREDAE